MNRSRKAIGIVSNTFIFTQLVTKAHDFALKKHAGQLDDTGKPYFEEHIEQVVQVLYAVTDDEVLLAAAFLHDTLEDTETTYEELVTEFGKEIADLVNEVTHDGNKDKGYYFPRLETKRGTMLKFADRLSNLSRMQAWDEKRQAHYLKRSRFWKKAQDEKLN